MRKPWTVTNCPYDNEMYAVEGEYTVCHNLPIEDATLISAAPDLLNAVENLIADLKLRAEPDLLNAVENLIADLKLRAEIDSRGYRVLNISDGVLMRAEKAIAKAKGEV